MFILLIRDNFSDYFDKKEEIKSTVKESYDSLDDGREFDNLRLYFKGTILTLFYIILDPILISIISLLLAFVSPVLSVMSFLFNLIVRFLVLRRREKKSDFENFELNDSENELIEDIKKVFMVNRISPYY